MSFNKFLAKPIHYISIHERLISSLSHLHIQQVLRNGCGELTVSRRVSSKEVSRPENYLPCTECKAWLFEKTLSIHSRSCPAGKSSDANLRRNSKMLLSPFITLDSDEAEIDDLIMKMKETSKYPGLKAICQGDNLIREFCRGLLHKLGTFDEQRRKDIDNVRTKVRAVGRLLIALNKKSGQDSHLESFISPKFFKLIVEVTKDLGKQLPSFALTLGHYIKQLCQLKQSMALQNENDLAKKEAIDFDLLLNAHWNNYVSAVTLRRMKLRTLNKTIELPKTSDMVRLKDYLDSEITEGLERLTFTYQQWSELAQVLMIRILLFNKRRVSEVEEMKVSDIIQAQNSCDNEEILSQMDITEKTLASRMTVIEVRGKSTRGLRKVFIILSQQMFKACQHLIEKRMAVGISPSNKYLFARIEGTPLDGCKAMRDVTEKCPDLETPYLIRTRLLRKYLATTIQLLDMSGDELKMVADHMGHSVSIHTDVYRLQTSLLEKTKVARALIALENGQLSKFAGKNLSSCSLEELPSPVCLEEEEVKVDDVYIAPESNYVSDEENDDQCPEKFESERREAETKASLISKNDGDIQFLTKRERMKHVRKRWDKDEESSIMEAFKENIKERSNPSGAEIRRAQERYPCLKERSIAVIRSKISNIILGKSKVSVQ